ncbi:unnamed protein product [Vitrella brassicaformis CCMP3155]|uniref:Uncharacterized protein n=1 Tax=Vitrella brassicaformis (strain CCMP3155) TaxID=1169540 RepID=A0A0G4GM89_VITBC|nr:unnamed protein product [Vitrella brassicaformis CCMP3155]|eukprot:CEM31322.1 unnamed protein product [Vitrella brassicaformis CCMP3155]
MGGGGSAARDPCAFNGNTGVSSPPPYSARMSQFGSSGGGRGMGGRGASNGSLRGGPRSSAPCMRPLAIVNADSGVVPATRRLSEAPTHIATEPRVPLKTRWPVNVPVIGKAATNTDTTLLRE